MKVIFSHGKESGPWGSKITALANKARLLGFDVTSLDYTDLMNPDERVARLTAYLEEQTQPYILVGSSMGGYVSLVAAQTHNPCGIFLLAPALFMDGYAQQSYFLPLTESTVIEVVHGWSDEVIPVEHSIKYAQQAKCSLHLIASDHRLNNALAEVTRLFSAFLDAIESD